MKNFLLLLLFILVISCASDNSDIEFSDSTPDTTGEMAVIFDGEIVSNSTGYLDIEKVKKTSDGYIVGAAVIPQNGNDTSVEIIKLDNNFNLLWSFNINQSQVQSDRIKGILDLQNGNYIAVMTSFQHTIVGTGNHQTYTVKFNNTGSILSTDYYNYVDTQNTEAWAEVPINTETSPGQLKIVTYADTTYSNPGNINDSFQREFEIDLDGNVVSNRIIGDAWEPPLWNVVYDENGNIFNYGLANFPVSDGMIQKYDSNFNLLWSRNFGNAGTDDSVDRLYFDNNKIVGIGKNGHENAFDGESLWVIYNDPAGNTIWDFKETRNNFIYQGKDIVSDSQNNVYALFLEIYFTTSHVYNIASVVKLDTNGNLIWKFKDGEDFNEDNFFPSKLYISNDNYSILGVKEGKIWLKKFSVN